MANIKVKSISGHSTCIQLPNYHTAFDMGACDESSVGMKNVLITHGHMDHIGAIAAHAARRQLEVLEPANYLMHPDNIEGAEMVFRGFEALGHEKIPRNLIPIVAGESYDIGGGRSVRPFNSPHRVPCQGYAIWSTKKRLKSEYHGLPDVEIAALARSGVQVNEQVVYPEVAYTGDTLIDVVEHEEVVRTVKHLIIEITFFDNRVPVKQARKWGHIHFREFLSRAHLFENERITVTHLSARYSKKFAEKMLYENLPESLRDRVEVMV